MGSPISIIRDHNIRYSRTEFKNEESKLKSYPRFLIVELTRRCNLSCSMCRPKEYNRHAPSMSENLFSKIEEELFPHADLIDLRGWGESLILKEFPDRLTRAASSGAKIRVISNLSFKRDSVLEQLVEVGAYIGVSIDSANPRILNQLRFGSNLELIRANLEYLSEKMKHAGHLNRLCLYVTCQRPGISELHKIVEFADDCGVKDVRIAPVSISNESELSILGQEDEIAAAISHVASLINSRGVKVSLTASLFENSTQDKSKSACLHPWTHCYIEHDGGISFCDHLIGPEAEEYIMGNLIDSKFESIWNSQNWIDLRKNHVNERNPNSPYFKECDWCYKNRLLDSEDILEPSLASERVYIGND